jgi:hypothetical protein
MSKEVRTFKVTLEFEVDINPITVPDAETLENMSADPAKKKAPMSEKEMRIALKEKGLEDDAIEKMIKQGASKKAGAGSKRPKNYQMLVYPEYEAWAAAQQSLQQEILGDDELSTSYAREMVRDLTRGQIETMIAEKYGEADLGSVLKTAMAKISETDQAVLKSDEESLLFDETELVDNSVACRFTQLTVRSQNEK